MYGCTDEQFAFVIQLGSTRFSGTHGGDPMVKHTTHISIINRTTLSSLPHSTRDTTTLLRFSRKKRVHGFQYTQLVHIKQ